MKKPFWRWVGILFLGAVIGTLAGQLLSGHVTWLSRTTAIDWNPQANLGVIRFSLNLTLRVNWLTLVGIVGAWFFASKRK